MVRRVVLCAMVLASASGAQGGAAAGRGDLATEVAKLQQEVANQREVLKYLLQDEQQRNSMLLQLLGGAKPTGQSPARSENLLVPEPSAAPNAARTMRPRPQPVPVPASFSVTGRVLLPSGEPLANAWVYVEDISSPAKGKALEIKQQNKTFIPEMTVVQRGTQLTFPNMDAVFHDVFSRSPGNTFEIGPIQSGEKSKAITVTRPGVVEIFCNFHAKMTAQVLVVPGPFFTSTNAQGRFQFDKLPGGTHTVAAWTGHATPVTVSLDVTQDVEGLELTVKPQASPAAHLNKSGQAYGSYGD